MNPVLTFHAPRKLGSSWVLAAEVRIGEDVVTVQAKLTPKTIQWALANARDAARWVQGKLAPYMSYRGDWKRFGFLGDVALGATNRIASSPTLSSYESAREALPLYLMVAGEKGPQKEAQAKAHMRRIEADANRGIAKALEARGEIYRLHMADTMLHTPSAYHKLRELSDAARQDDLRAIALLGSVKALGSSSPGAIYLDYDVEDVLVEPRSADSLAGLASDVMALRALGVRGQTLAPYEVSRVFAECLPTDINPAFLGLSSNRSCSCQADKACWGGAYLESFSEKSDETNIRGNGEFGW